MPICAFRVIYFRIIERLLFPLINYYDYRGRRVCTDWSLDDGYSTYGKEFFNIYDEWNLLLEMDIIDGPLHRRAYAWGPDLSGTLHGAGGVGGLYMGRLYDGSDQRQPRNLRGRLPGLVAPAPSRAVAANQAGAAEAIPGQVRGGRLSRAAAPPARLPAPRSLSRAAAFVFVRGDSRASS